MTTRTVTCALCKQPKAVDEFGDVDHDCPGRRSALHFNEKTHP